MIYSNGMTWWIIAPNGSSAHGVMTDSASGMPDAERHFLCASMAALNAEAFNLWGDIADPDSAWYDVKA